MKKEKGYLILGLICLVCAGITGGLLLRYGLQSHKQQEQHDAIAQIYHENDGPPDEKVTSQDTDKSQDAETDAIPSTARLQELNPDCVGWLQIPDTGLDYPVVYRDNQYYLTHNFMDERASAGAIFLDEGCDPDGDIRLLHGHHMKDGSMFGILTHYRNLDFLRRHPLIAFSTLWEKEAYVVFAVLVVSSRTGDTGYFNYFDHATFTSGEDFDSYILALRNRSRFEIPVDVECGDALLTLSTCIDDDRLVVAARRLRVGETKDELSAAVEAAYRQR